MCSLLADRRRDAELEQRQREDETQECDAAGSVGADVVDNARVDAVDCSEIVVVVVVVDVAAAAGSGVDRTNADMKPSEDSSATTERRPVDFHLYENKRKLSLILYLVHIHLI